MQSFCQLFSLFAVILLFSKDRMLDFFLLFGFGGLVLFLVSTSGHPDNSAVGLDSIGATNEFWNLDLPSSFLVRCSHPRLSQPFKVKVSLDKLFFWKLGKDGHGQIGNWMNVLIKFILSNHCKGVGHVEVFDVEEGRNEIVRG